MTTERPSLGFISIDSGGRPGRPPSQSEIVAGLFQSDGFVVKSASKVASPVPRTCHQLLAALCWRVDVLIISVYSGNSFLYADLTALIGAMRRATKVVLVLHGGGLASFSSQHERQARRALDRADLIVAPSRFLADFFEQWGYPARVIPNVLDLEQYDYAPRREARPALLWMRTFHDDYDPLTALEVLRILSVDEPEVRLTMAGPDQGLLGSVNERSAALRLGDRVHFPGFLDSAGKRWAFAEHDVFLNTNKVDNMPVSILEAMASGLVTVSTRVGGIPHLLTHEVDSLLVAPGDPRRLAEAVHSVLVSPPLFSRLSAGARQTASQSAWPAVKQRWLDALGEI